jgi:hypothetical protein
MSEKRGTNPDSTISGPENIKLRDAQLDIDIEGDETHVSLSDPEIEVIGRRRAPSTAVLDGSPA